MLKTLVALPLAGSVPVRPPPGQDALAVIGIGTYGMSVLAARGDCLPWRVRGVGIESSIRRGMPRRLREVFRSIHHIDVRASLPEDRMAPFKTPDRVQWQALFSALPQQENWLIVGSLEEQTCHTVLSWIVRRGTAMGKRVHVFVLGPYCYDGADDAASRAVLRVQQCVGRDATSAVVMRGDALARQFGWNSATDGWNWDVHEKTLKVFEDACHAWMLRHCEAYGRCG